MQCMSCVPLCARGAHHMEDGRHRVDLSVCQECDAMEACSKSCPTGALRLCGEEYTVEQLLERVLTDRAFYGGEGGVTCSGGEPLLRDDFLFEFLARCKGQGIHTCVDTTLNVEWERIGRLLPCVDLFLVDIKLMDDALHMEYTGAHGGLTVDNLRRLSERGKAVILRMPLIGGVNDSEGETRARRKLLGELTNVQRLDCFAVTGHAKAKYQALQREFVPFNQGVKLEELAESVKSALEA